MYNIVNKAHVYDLPKRPSQTTTSAGKSFHGTVRRTRDPRSPLLVECGTACAGGAVDRFRLVSSVGKDDSETLATLLLRKILRWEK